MDVCAFPLTGHDEVVTYFKHCITSFKHLDSSMWAVLQLDRGISF